MTPERSRCLRTITQLLESGNALSKHTAAKQAYCDKRTAERVLAHLWLMKMIRIVSWEQIYNNTTPRYRWGVGPDAPRPRAMTPAEKARKQRQKSGEKEKRNFKRRAARSVGKEVRLGMFGV